MPIRESLSKQRQSLKKAHRDYLVQQRGLTARIEIQKAVTGIPQSTLSSASYSRPEGQLYLTDIAKNLLDTFQSYKTARHRNRDLFQVFYGVVNTLWGIASVIHAAKNFAWTAFKTIAFLPWAEKGTFKAAGAQLREDLIADLLGSGGQILLGLSQMITSPLSLVRVTWRSALSRKRPWQKFQERKSIINLVREADALLLRPELGQSPQALNNMRDILESLAYKAASNQKKKQKEIIAPGRVGEATPTSIEGLINKQREDYTTGLTSKEIGDIRKFISFFRIPPSTLGTSSMKTSKNSSAVRSARI